MDAPAHAEMPLPPVADPLPRLILDIGNRRGFRRIMVMVRVGRTDLGESSLPLEPGRFQSALPGVENSRLFRQQLGHPTIKPGNLLRRAKIGFIGDNNISCRDLILKLYVFQNLLFFKPSRVDQAKHRAQLKHILIMLSRQGFNNLGGMPKTRWFNQQSVWLGFMNQLVESDLHR